MIIREEKASDAALLRALVARAFRTMPYSRHNEATLLADLRRAGALAPSLVAEEDGVLLGQIAFSPALIGGRAGWLAMGPIAVEPRFQRQGIGSALVREGLRRLAERGDEGCVLVGDPAFYGRFGFRPVSSVVVDGVPEAFVLVLPLQDRMPSGEVGFHPAFAVAPEADVIG
ncbi:GNAT family N-acetyltransferase [Consotaella salsifontis]|uniref:Putative acetyltransferase n=1 Tax=Consotaella salsifontis TaxID=1365950 RepID=A0A1T4SR98_9HYPH|nr:N-acetyltransferase [Consotaella salsifontis]SKA30800.1 putative acetyltransferase [Consotaella salsifontis]